MLSFWFRAFFLPAWASLLVLVCLSPLAHPGSSELNLRIQISIGPSLGFRKSPGPTIIFPATSSQHNLPVNTNARNGRRKCVEYGALVFNWAPERTRHRICALFHSRRSRLKLRR
ncbi:hypothetical protein C8R45DRAFT_116921 [Mycena sanguinolenta]|nr:hypothetical protein C8R45DRAFT_116921 [Mycena sanguinolenta]